MSYFYVALLNLKQIVKSQVLDTAKSIDALSLAIRDSIKLIVWERMDELSEDFKNEIKRSIIGKINDV